MMTLINILQRAMAKCTLCGKCKSKELSGDFYKLNTFLFHAKTLSS